MNMKRSTGPANLEEMVENAFREGFNCVSTGSLLEMDEDFAWEQSQARAALITYTEGLTQPA